MFERQLAFFALFCLAAVVFLAKPHETTLPANDASTYAALAMSATSQGIVPRLPIGQEVHGGHWGQGFNDMTFVFPYLNGWIMRALGPDAFSAKLLPCLLSIGCVMLTAWLGLLLSSPLTGLLAGVILALTRDFYIDGLNAHLDTNMIFFILGSFIAWIKRRYWLAGALAGVGLWFKNPVAFLIFPSVIVFHSVRGELKSQWTRIVGSFAVAAAVGFSIWILTGILGGWELVWDYWQRQVWGTAIGGRGGAQERDLFLIFRVLTSRYLPWTIFLLWGIGWAVSRRKWKEPKFLLPASAAAVMVLVISAMRFKYAHYYVPAYPFLALIAALPVSELLVKRETTIYRGFAIVTLAGVTFLMATPVQTAPESFPAFRKFAAIVQSYGDCCDQVVFVEGHQPYGTGFDYKELFNFYTGRHVQVTSCDGASGLALRPEVGWIMVTRPNFEQCLSGEVRAKFKGVYGFGSQMLLSRYEIGPWVDLTPLARELRAATDCRPAPLPEGRYFRDKVGDK